MRKLITVALSLLFLTTACSRNEANTNKWITVQVTKNGLRLNSGVLFLIPLNGSGTFSPVQDGLASFSVNPKNDPFGLYILKGNDFCLIDKFTYGDLNLTNIHTVAVDKCQ